MKNIWAITKKELKSYFVSPLAYIVSAIFLIITGFMFFNMLSGFALASMQYARYPQVLDGFNLNNGVVTPLLLNTSLILLFITPALTMRIFSEEVKNGTMDLLFTSPITTFEIVMGKFFGCALLFLLMLGLSFSFIIVLLVYGKLDIAPLLSGYLGLLLLELTFISLGMWMSSLTRSQIIAFIGAFGVLLFLWIIAWPARFVNTNMASLLNYFSLQNHFFDLARGLLDTKDIVFYISCIFGGLFLSYQTLVSQQWRG
ncbi:MAG: ABC transporter permease [bacterium]